MILVHHKLTRMPKVAPVAPAISHVNAKDRNCGREIVLVENALELVPDELEALSLSCKSATLRDPISVMLT